VTPNLQQPRLVHKPPAHKSPRHWRRPDFGSASFVAGASCGVWLRRQRRFLRSRAASRELAWRIRGDWRHRPGTFWGCETMWS
jgi:hypothetical protein